MILLLSLKPELHRFITLIEESELNAAPKLILISVVILPVLLNKGHGPWETINPFELWWMVVLIPGISFVGYIFIKLMGARRGILFTGLFGGIVSLTVVTLNFSRMAKEKNFSNIFATGILVASGTMFPRMLLYVLVVNYNLFSHLIIPIFMMTVVAYAAVLWFLLKGTKIDDSTKRQAIPISNPFQLLPALAYGVLLAAIILLSYTFKEWFGDKGIYLLSLFSGIGDVDAITIALSKLGKI